MNAVAVDAELLEELKSLLRRDLKLGPAATIDDDMPLIGGDLDLDSLDILLTVSSIEKHFQIKIPNEVVGRWAFQNVSTLARFVQENREAAKGTQNPTAGPNSEGWLALLPHGREFRFITDVHDVVAGKHASAAWKVDGSEWFLKAHFPGRPIVPGVLVIESLAQLAGLACSDGSATGGVLAHADVKFDRPIVPPARIALSANVVRSIGTLRMCDVQASVNMQGVARGTVAIKLDSNSST